MNTPKKNIGMLIDHLVGGGAERVALSLSAVLSALGHRVDIIVLHKTTHYPIDNVDFNVHFIETPCIEDVQAKIKNLNVEFDLVLSHLSGASQAGLALNLPNHYCCIHGAQFSLHEFVTHRRIYKIKGGVSRVLSKIKYKLSRNYYYDNVNLIAVSKGVAESVVELGIKPQSIRTIYNPFNFTHIRTQAEQYAVDESDYIIHVGGYYPGKRHDVLINAYHQSGIPEKLLLLGAPVGGRQNRSLKQAKALVADLKLQDKVIFKEFNPNPFPYIKNSKALVLSSDNEGLPTVLIEALVLGVPVISTDCPAGPSEILVAELSAFLSPVGDVEALAVNIRKMLQDPIQITEKYIRKFDDAHIAQQYLALCNDQQGNSQPDNDDV